DQGGVGGAVCGYFSGEGCLALRGAASVGRAEERVSGGWVLCGGESALWSGVHGVPEREDQDEERKAAGGREGGGEEESDGSLSDERRTARRGTGGEAGTLFRGV